MRWRAIPCEFSSIANIISNHKKSLDWGGGGGVYIGEHSSWACYCSSTVMRWRAIPCEFSSIANIISNHKKSLDWGGGGYILESIPPGPVTALQQ